MSKPESTLSQLALAAAARGVQTLAPGRAMTIRARRDGELCVVRGSIWATRNGPHAATAGAAQGDLFLTAGTRLALRTGETVVLEPIGLHGATARVAAFDWCDARRPWARWLQLPLAWASGHWSTQVPQHGRCEA